jgi:glycosyltransferase involved in cell wall biosynthesis
MEQAADITVVILTYNESLHLARALAHVKPFASHILVVDSYSNDDTVEIAKAHGATVLQHAFQNQAKQFQWALDHGSISTEWVMRLDADEIIEPDLAREIVSRLPKLGPEITGVYLNRKTIFQGKFIRHGGRYPMMLLRIWRRGKARIEDRWMDEHIYLTEGCSVTFQGGFSDYSLRDLTFFIDKHNGYASREALDSINRRLNLWNVESVSKLPGDAEAHHAGQKRFMKEVVYNRIPFQISSVLYFLYRYVIRLGFLDGAKGLVYHVLQGFWYRFLVGAKLEELENAIRGASSADEARSRIARVTRQRIAAD